MKRGFLTITALVALSFGAQAQVADPFTTGDSHGPRSPQNGSVGCVCSAPKVLVAQAAPRYEFNAGVWQPFATNPNAVDAAELRRQQAVNREWRYHAFSAASQVGPWGDGMLAPEFASQAWNKLSPGDVNVGRNPNPEPSIGSSID